MTSRRTLALALGVAASLAGCDRRVTPGRPTSSPEAGPYPQGRGAGSATLAAPDARVNAGAGSAPAAAEGTSATSAEALRAARATPATGHPRLWVREADLPKLRARAVASNPFYQALVEVTDEAQAAMNKGAIPSEGRCQWDGVFCEGHAELFAFMSLISNDEKARSAYAGRARKILLHIMDRVLNGGAKDNTFAYPFSTGDRSRWAGESFGLTVDWIYPYLTKDDKSKIRTVFLRWAEEQLKATTTGHDHPEPIGKLNDPSMLESPQKRRYAVNNYYTAHMRNLTLMSLSFDPADDPAEATPKGQYPRLRDYFANVAGAWLYMTDHVLRQDARGGLPPEGFQYGPQTLAYVAQTLLAIQTAGEADTGRWGKQVNLDGNPFWQDVIPAYIHSLSPGTVAAHSGPSPEVAWVGDGQRYDLPDHIDSFAALGLHAENAGNPGRASALRWLSVNLAPSGAGALPRRARSGFGDSHKRPSIMYFLLLDPAAASADPRPSLPLDFYGPGLGQIFSRTSWGADATWFQFRLGWEHIDHQHGDGLSFGFYRAGEWLTKERVGYGSFFVNSDQHNTLTVENDVNRYKDDPYRAGLRRRGSQWTLMHTGDPKVVAKSFAKDYVYALGDATALYNSEYETIDDVKHVSRSIVWLKPDHLVIYDRASTGKEDRFKRFFLQTANLPVVSGKLSTVTTPKGQKLFVTTLLPEAAVIAPEAYTRDRSNWETTPADGEPMMATLRVEPRKMPKDARFLHVLQGADAGATPGPVALVRSTRGAPYAGAAVKSTLVLFPVDLGAVSEVAFTTPAGTKRSLVTGLTPSASYDVARKPAAGGEEITIRPGTAMKADEGGVLSL